MKYLFLTILFFPLTVYSDDIDYAVEITYTLNRYESFSENIEIDIQLDNLDFSYDDGKFRNENRIKFWKPKKDYIDYEYKGRYNKDSLVE
jgi:hypothetical protein